LIMHIDENQSGNGDQTHYMVDIEQGDGRCDLNLNKNYGDQTDPYPSGQAATFNSVTVPNSKLYSGVDSRVAITEITRSGDVITAIVSTAEKPAPVWYNNKAVSSTSASCQSQTASANISGLGWRQILAGAPESVTNILDICCQALARGKKVNVYADDAFIYTVYLV